MQGRTARDGATQLLSMFTEVPLTVDEFLVAVEELYEEVFGEYFGLMPGAEKLVKHLKDRNVPICIATSSKNTTFQLKSKHHGSFLEQFHHVVKGSDDPSVKQGKPAPDIFLAAAERFPDAPTDMKNVSFATFLL